MALNRNSKMSEIFANDQAYELLLKHVPGCKKDDPRMGAAMGMSVKGLLSFPQTRCPKAVREAFFEELEAANIE